MRRRRGHPRGSPGHTGTALFPRFVLLVAALALGAGIAGSALAAKDDTILVSRATATPSPKGNGPSSAPSASRDGRFVAFTSEATNLHPADSDPGRDVFVHDRQAGTTTLVSRAAGAAGAKGNGDSSAAAISADGRFVAFVSQASNLHPDDTDAIQDLFVRDLQAHTTTLASRATGAAGSKGNDSSFRASLSADGRYVSYFSRATNLHPDDSDAQQDVFQRDLQANATTLVSRAAGVAGAKGNGDSSEAATSANGRFVAFQSEATNLHADDADVAPDILVRDLQAHTTTLVSRASGVAGAKGNFPSFRPSISATGRFVAFSSAATTLHPDDTDSGLDVFVRDVQADTTALASRASGTAGANGNGDSVDASISGDGRVVAFQSEATNLHPDDADSSPDVFARVVLRRSETTELVSRATGAAGAKGNGASGLPSVSADGRDVAFHSAASNLDPNDKDPALDVHVRDSATDATTLASRASGGGTKGNDNSFQSSISANGRFVAFMSTASNLDPDDTDPSPQDNHDIFVRDLQAQTAELVSRASGTAGADGNATSLEPSISGDGRAVAFRSGSTNLHPDDSDAISDVFARVVLRRAAATTLVSRATGAGGAKGNGESWKPAISVDGRFAAFQSQATNLHPNDTDSGFDVFVRDLQTNTTTLVSRATGVAGVKGNDISTDPSISRDGRFVAFRSDASNLHTDDPDASPDVFVRDLQTNTTTLVSRATGATGAKANGGSIFPSISVDGRFVSFMSQATNLHPDDPDSTNDVFLRDLPASTTTLVSRATGVAGAKGNNDSFLLSAHPSISADGGRVAFSSLATNLHPDDTDGSSDVLVRDLQASTTTLVSRATGAAGAKGNAESFDPSMSGDGRFVAFDSAASNLHPDDTDVLLDVFVRDVFGPRIPPA